MRLVDTNTLSLRQTAVLSIIALSVSGAAGCVSAPAPLADASPRPTLETFRTDDAPCYDRSAQPETSVVDTHVHLRPFGGQAIPFEEVMQFFAETGVLFANVYGIGQMLPASSACTYYLDCPGTLVVPTLKNDFVNAANFVTKAPAGVHLTLSMSFPDLARPESILPGMALLEEEYPGVFTWMGEVNLVKQALFDNGRAPVPVAAIGEWAAFMDVLRERGIPLAIHSDLGNNDNPTRYVPLMEEVMRLYPENPIVWVHMGLSRELTDLDAAQHVELMTAMLDRHPNLMLDISWRVLDDTYFSDGGKRAVYVTFLNAYSERILSGTDFLASRDKDLNVYRTELEVTSRINRYLTDAAFRNIALGENYFRLLGLAYEAPPVCTD